MEAVVADLRESGRWLRTLPKLLEDSRAAAPESELPGPSRVHSANVCARATAAARAAPVGRRR